MNDIKFSCNQCGRCCRELKYESDDKIPRFEDGFQVILAQTTLPLFDFELEIFKKHGHSDIVVPSRVMFDLKNNVTIVMERTLKTNSCPFVDEKNRCKIYDERPITCRSFPCNIRINEENKKMIIDNQSPNFCEAELPRSEILKLFGEDKGQAKTSISKVMHIAYERYGNSYIDNEIRHIIEKTYAQGIMSLQNSGEAKFAKEGYDLKYLIPRIQNSQTIGISEIFNDTTEESIQFTIKKFRTEFKEKLEE